MGEMSGRNVDLEYSLALPPARCKEARLCLSTEHSCTCTVLVLFHACVQVSRYHSDRIPNGVSWVQFNDSLESGLLAVLLTPVSFQMLMPREDSGGDVRFVNKPSVIFSLGGGTLLVNSVHW